MLTGGLDDGYRNALAGPHTRYVLVEVLDGTGAVLAPPDDRVGDDGGLAFIGGTVTATLASRVTRTLSLTVDQALYPALSTDLLAPYGNQLRATMGIQFADGNRYAWVCFVGRIQSANLTPSGTCQVECSDYADKVQEAGFLVPSNSQAGNSVNSEFVRLVSDGVPGAVFGTSDTFAQTVPVLTWDQDRSAAIDEMATTVGAYWYCLADGSFVMRRVPWTVPGNPILTLSDGAAGTILGEPERLRSDVWNSITVTGERADGTPPVYAIAEDTNPDSPTYVLGPFGRRHKPIRLQTPATQGSAQSAAQDYLRTSIALFETWAWTQPPDAALELGDIVSLNAYDRTGIIQVVSGFRLPLEVSASMEVRAHAQVLGVIPG
jgi:hypothetical protein